MLFTLLVERRRHIQPFFPEAAHSFTKHFPLPSLEARA